MDIISHGAVILGRLQIQYALNPYKKRLGQTDRRSKTRSEGGKEVWRRKGEKE